MKLNSAGRFWLSYVAFWLFGLLFSIHSYAGYSATVTAYVPTMSYTGFALNQVSGCFLTPGMAISSMSGTQYYWQLTSLNSDGTWTAVGTTGTHGSASGTFSICQADPGVSWLPPMAGGVVDPAISGDSVLSGSGGGSSGGMADMEAYLGFNAELFEIAVAGSLVVFAIGFGVGLVINTIRRGRTF